MTDYEISRTTGKCAQSGRTLEEGEEYYTVVLETEEGFVRRDYSQDAWEGPPDGALCYFKTCIHPKEAPRRTFVDDDLLIRFFTQLGDAEDESKHRFRFVLGLILLRKRLLKYQGTIRKDDREYWQMRLMRDKSLHQVLNPSLNEDEIESLCADLSTILHCDREDGADDRNAHGGAPERSAGEEDGAPKKTAPASRSDEDRSN